MNTHVIETVDHTPIYPDVMYLVILLAVIATCVFAFAQLRQSGNGWPVGKRMKWPCLIWGVLAVVLFLIPRAQVVWHRLSGSSLTGLGTVISPSPLWLQIAPLALYLLGVAVLLGSAVVFYRLPKYGETSRSWVVMGSACLTSGVLLFFLFAWPMIRFYLAF